MPKKPWPSPYRADCLADENACADIAMFSLRVYLLWRFESRHRERDWTLPRPRAWHVRMSRVMAMQTDPNQMLTTEEAAALLGLKAATLANWREDGSADLAFSKFGRSVRYRYGDVVAFAERRQAHSTLAARRLDEPQPIPRHARGAA